ncbi:MAG: hypothetical protein QOJ99_1541 [Bryobacterales bacterium]|nr:hypothetical protein [Bryobacterales bacterium]
MNNGKAFLACSGFAFAAILLNGTFAQQLKAQGNGTSAHHAGHDMADMHEKKDKAGSPVAGKTADAPEDMSQMDHSKMPGMSGHEGMPGMKHGMDMNEAGKYLMNLSSGTSMNPQSWPMPMLMPRLGSWNLMIMGQGFLVDTQQSGPRGGDKFYSPNWGMVSAEHSFLGGGFMFQSMFSLDPLTITNRRYPLLFQTGETAYGKALVDAQHPHDLIMGLGMNYAHSLGENTMLHFYYAPVGDPALGPVAFPHRASALELPQATLGHHWQDSTHIADNVLTVALRHKWFRLEASGFYGTEPNENRWNFDWGPVNSYSGRFSVFPSKNWMAQISAGRLADPERPFFVGGHAETHGDVVRTTASVHYTRPMEHGNAWSTSLIWGQNHVVQTDRNTNSYLVETMYPLTKKDFLTGRVEVVDKDELFANDPDLQAKLAQTAGSSFRIQGYTAGYTRDIGFFKNVETGVGANFTAYAIPSAIKPYYGDHPWGANVFLRVRLKPAE